MTHNNDASEALQNLRLESPTSPSIPAANQLSSDIQARILAFQQKRRVNAPQQPPPDEPPVDDSTVGHAKPLPPLPPSFLMPSAHIDERARSYSSNSVIHPNPNAIPHLSSERQTQQAKQQQVPVPPHHYHAQSQPAVPHSLHQHPNQPTPQEKAFARAQAQAHLVGAQTNSDPPVTSLDSALAGEIPNIVPPQSQQQAKPPVPITLPNSNTLNRSPPKNGTAGSSSAQVPPQQLLLNQVRGNGAEGLKKKPSLSQRRGMKLDMGSLQNEIAPASAPATATEEQPQQQQQQEFSKLPPITAADPAPLKTTGEISRRLSDRKNKPNFKLGLNDNKLNNNGNSTGAVANSNNGINSNNGSSSSSSSAAAPEKKSQLQGLFANYAKYVDIKSGSLNFSGKASLHSKGVDFSSGSSFRISLEELEFIEELGRGNYGTVSKVLHKPTGVLMAMKEVRLELDETKFTQILMELDILHKCNSPFIVDFYGAFFVEGAVYMCMEYMDGGSLDKICTENGVTSEKALAYISESVIRGLKELKDEHNIIHRDVKPTNILVNTLGKVKLCDFGVSGNLVASLAKTNIGCQSYMAPERIKTQNPADATYSVQSDIWSLGLTILEIAAGHYPYPPETYGNIFSQLNAIVDGEPPKLDPKTFSKDAQYFVKQCLNKNPDLRPSYAVLLNNPWLVKYRDVDPEMDKIVTKRVEEIEEEKAKRKSLSRSSSLKQYGATGGAAGVIPGAGSAASGGIPNIPTGTIPIAGAAAGHGNKQVSRENVKSLLKDKVRAPALHRRGLPERRPVSQQSDQGQKERGI